MGKGMPPETSTAESPDSTAISTIRSVSSEVSPPGASSRLVIFSSIGNSGPVTPRMPSTTLRRNNDLLSTVPPYLSERLFVSGDSI